MYTPSVKAVRENTDKYTFIHPLLAVGRVDSDIQSPEYKPLLKNIQSLIDTAKSAGGVSDASVYFLNYGKESGSFAIDQNVPYSPASLLKVVIMVAYFKKSETEPSLLTREFVYAPSVAKSLEAISFENPTKLTIGSHYSASDLIDRMIIDSDNGAMNVLLANMDDAYLSQVYTELGLEGPQADSTYTISAKNYSLFFRILYNGTYLSDTLSERALSLLSKTTFKDGLVGGVPAGTLVAHKYGEHINSTNDKIESIELHDCGYVYDKNGPYLLCVMTRGTNYDALSSLIQEISHRVSARVNSVI